jgi:hypothetical protein
MSAKKRTSAELKSAVSIETILVAVG